MSLKCCYNLAVHGLEALTPLGFCCILSQSGFVDTRPSGIGISGAIGCPH